MANHPHHTMPVHMSCIPTNGKSCDQEHEFEGLSGYPNYGSWETFKQKPMNAMLQIILYMTSNEVSVGLGWKCRKDLSHIK